MVARDRPKTNADFLIAPWISQGHSFLRRFSKLDALLDDAAENADMKQRKADYAEAQQILARDVPAINLWYRDTVVVHNKRLTHVVPAPSGSYVFLETAELAQ